MSDLREFIVQGDFSMIVSATDPDAAYEFTSDYLSRDASPILDGPRLEGWRVVEVGEPDE